MLEMNSSLFWEIKSPLLTNKRKELWIFRFFKWFSKIWKIREKYKADKIKERANPCPTPTSIL